MTAIAAAVALGAIAQAASGIGFVLVCGPLLIASQGRDEGVQLAVGLSAVLNAAMLLREHKAIRYADGAAILVPALIVTPLVIPVVRQLDERPATAIAGGLTVVAAAALLRGVRFAWLRGLSGAALTGAVASVMNVLAGIAGPAVAIFTANENWPAASLRSTLQAIFLVLNLVTLALIGIPPLSPWLLLALGAGYGVGAVLAHRLSDRAARTATLLVAAAGGVAAVIRAAS